jgi:hypothetical protein
MVILCKSTTKAAWFGLPDRLDMTTRTQSDPIISNYVSFITCVASVVAMLAATPVHGAEWIIDPLIRVAANFDDNANLSVRTDNEESISGYIAEGSARFAYASELTSFFVTPILRYRDYGDPRFDENEQFLQLQFDHDTQRNSFRIEANYDLEAVRTAERSDADLDIEDPDDIRDEETGRVFLQGRRERIELKPRWTYRLSDASSLSASLAYRDTQYENNFDGLLDDYTNGRANVSYKRSWSPRYSVIVTGTYRQYIPDVGEEKTGAGVKGGIEGALSENMRLRALAGFEETKGETGGSVREPVWEMSLVRRLQTIELLAQYRRTISGTGSGTVSSRDEINLYLTRELSERISAGLGARAYTTNALEGDVENFDERDYVQLRAVFVWNLTRKWSVEADYRYTFLNRELIGESANSNDVSIWLNYRPTGRNPKTARPRVN